MSLPKGIVFFLLFFLFYFILSAFGNTSAQALSVFCDTEPNATLSVSEYQLQKQPQQ